VEEILTLLSLLMPAFSLPAPPRQAYAAASTARERSPTAPPKGEARGFGGMLEPR
jgi:hypothetical protein